LTKILTTELLSILENATHFLPKSLKDAPTDDIPSCCQ
jgi:hypothetical protein